MYHTLRHDDQDVASQFYCLVISELASEEYFECYQCDYQNPEEAAMPDHVIGKLISYSHFSNKRSFCVLL